MRGFAFLLHLLQSLKNVIIFVKRNVFVEVLEMKKYLLPEEGEFYKANLHSHSTISDGDMTPEEMKEWYKAHGYQILAFTDHDSFVCHNDLTDPDFLILNGFEVQIYDLNWLEARTRKTAHICSIALDPETVNQPCFHRNWYTPNRVRHLIKFDESEPDYVKTYTGDGVSDFIKRSRDAGFFVTYNHPTWSLESYPEYSGYNYMHAVEICNFSSWYLGFAEYNPRVYDDMLRQGKRIYCIGADDNHSEAGSFGAFTMIKAKSLDYKTVTDAMLRGDFYTSRGPLINSLVFEDGKVKITTSPAKTITLETGVRYAGAERPDTPDGFVTEAEFTVPPECVYFRLTVYDENGLTANTNAYFLDELAD
jgi:hypothetical protein